ncbi:MAG: hypothetical protein RR343_05030 [Oscillospiraceae bacterium]
MSYEILTPILTFLGTTLGTLSGIIVSAKLTNYRLLQLEKKVDKHNNFAERIPVIDEKISVLNHRVDDLEHIG